jgi:hypothetical protein
MAKKNFDQQLAALEGLRQQPPSASSGEAVRKGLANANNYIVSKAAQIAEEQGATALIPDLLSCLDRFYVNASKTDPQCWAKNALISALAGLGHFDSAVYLRGLRHVQMEAVWDGQRDTAGPLRQKCALALTECRDLSDPTILSHLIELFIDREKPVRVEGARAIGRIDREEAALLLRLNALKGDREPEVVGACFSALLGIQGDAGIGFVSGFLERGGEVAEEAALAIGATRSLRAFQVLKGDWDRGRNPSLAKMLLAAMALTRQTEAVDFLLQLIASDGAQASAAIEALATAALPEEVRLQAAAAVEATGNPHLRHVFAEYFRG